MHACQIEYVINWRAALSLFVACTCVLGEQRQSHCGMIARIILLFLFLFFVVDRTRSRLMFLLFHLCCMSPFTKFSWLYICMWISDITCVHRWTAYVVMFITIGSVMRVDNLHLIVLCFVLSPF